MSITISIIGSPDNRFVQWDTDRQIKVEGAEGEWKAHFYTDCLDAALVVPHDDDGIVDVPNTLLMRTCPITVAIYRQDTPGEEGRTVYMQTIRIQPRVMPEDYRYEENVGYIDWIAKASEVEAYIEALRGLKESGAFDGVGISSARIDSAGHLILIKTDGTEIDAGKIPGGGGGDVDPEEIRRIVNEALEEAKDSGEFDGPKGDPGERGPAGPTGAQGVGIDHIYIDGNHLRVVLTNGNDLDAGVFPGMTAEQIAKLDGKMEKHLLTMSGSTIYDGNTACTHAYLKSLLEGKTAFAVLLYGTRAYHPQTVDSSVVEFISTDTNNGLIQVKYIALKSDNTVSITSAEAEKTANKSQTVDGSTTKFPSNKAVQLYVANQIGTIDTALATLITTYQEVLA